MNKRSYSGLNYSYVVDDDYRLISLSEGMREIYPRVRNGQVCYRAIHDKNEPCSNCPLDTCRSSETTVFNKVLGEWVNTMCVDVKWPAHNNASMIVCNVLDNMGSGIMQRIPYMAGYDVFFEMNLTQNKFRRFFHGSEFESLNYEDEPLDELMDRTLSQLVHPLDQKRFAAFWDFTSMSRRLKSAGGTLHDEFIERNARGSWDLIHTTVVPDTSPSSGDEIIIAMYTVIRSPQLAQIALNASSLTSQAVGEVKSKSAMSNLVRPEEYLTLLERQLTNSPAGSKCIVHFDIENFRFFNRWFGRKAGDALLEAFADYLLRLEADFNSLPCRLSNDNFAFTLPYDRSLVERVFNELNEILQTYSDSKGFRLVAGAHHAKDAAISPEDVLDAARSASRISRANSTACLTWFQEDFIQQHEERLHSSAEIQTALETGQFVPFFQPKCYMKTGEIIGAEVLARWNHPQKGVLSPIHFIPALEESGDIAILDKEIWRKTFELLGSWLEKDYTVPPISINVSGVDANSFDIAEELINLAEKYDVDPHFIEVELTETAVGEKPLELHAMMDRLREYGFDVAIDDFGSGYSSLNMLKDIPADILKLDLKFLDFTEDNTSKAVNIVHSIIEMSHTLGIPIVIEGVETQRQVDVLLELNCQYAQGYLFHKPMSTKDFIALIESGAPTLPEGICIHYSSHVSKRTVLQQNEFDQAAINSIPNPMVLYELDGEDINILRYNEAFSRIVGADELMRRSRSIQQYINERDLPGVYEMFRLAKERPSFTQRCRCWIQTESGPEVQFSIAVNYTSDEGSSSRFFGLPTIAEDDLSEAIYQSEFMLVNRNLLNELSINSSISELLIESVIGPIAIYNLTNGNLQLKGANAALMEVFDETPEKLERPEDRDVLKQMLPEDIPHFRNMLTEAIMARDAGAHGVCRFIRRSDDKIIWCRMSIYLFREHNDGYEFIASVVDDSERHENIHMLEMLSHHDELTGLYNRRAYLELQEKLAGREDYAFVLADIDDFKITNDTYGHAVGDAVIKRVAEVMVSTFRSCDYICRIGGDEIVVIVTGCTSNLYPVLQRKVDDMNEALQSSSGELPPTSLSVGIAFANVDHSFDDLYRAADTALYQTKRSGKASSTLANFQQAVFDLETWGWTM